MIALNHTVFAVLIAVSIKQPALIAPFALASHFALDTLPHFGNSDANGIYTRKYYRVIYADAGATAIAFIAAVIIFPTHSANIFLATFFSVLPDLLWPFAPKVSKASLMGRFYRFHKDIQRFERADGAYLELIWLVVFIISIVVVVR